MRNCISKEQFNTKKLNNKYIETSLNMNYNTK